MNGMKLKGWTSEGTDNFFKRVIINVKPSDFSCFFLLKMHLSFLEKKLCNSFINSSKLKKS